MSQIIRKLFKLFRTFNGNNRHIMRVRILNKSQLNFLIVFSYNDKPVSSVVSELDV